MKKTVARMSDTNVTTPRNALAEQLDHLSAECLALAHDNAARPEDYERLAGEIETLAVTLRESTTRIRAEVSGTRPSLTLAEAKRVIEALRAEDAVRNDVQRALA